METTDNNTYKGRCCGGRPKAHWIILGVLGAAALVFLFGAVIMWLWNGLMPAIFHLGVITYWQAVGLAILARLIFGFGHHGHHRGGKMHRHFMWRRGSRMHGSDAAMRWSYYEQYWNEEGEKAFNEYVDRKTRQ
jgi:hypothetical protein